MIGWLKSVLSFCWSVVLQWIKGSGSDDSTLRLRDAEIASQRERIAALEAALATERAERLRVLDEKAASVRDAAGAAELLRSVTGARPADPAK